MTDDRNLEKFIRYHEANPLVWQIFEETAIAGIKAGRKFWSSKAIFEKMRHDKRFETKGEKFKLCNTHTAFYARLFIREHPEYAGFLRTKKRKR